MICKISKFFRTFKKFDSIFIAMHKLQYTDINKTEVFQQPLVSTLIPNFNKIRCEVSEIKDMDWGKDHNIKLSLYTMNIWESLADVGVNFRVLTRYTQQSQLEAWNQMQST
jgi:hypothetical protein